MYSKNTDADALFKRLDVELFENIDSQYFNESRDFRSLIEVLEVLGQKVDQISRSDASNTSGEDLLAVLKDRNPAYNKLLNQRKIVEAVIEDVVKFQHGGLNNSVDTMSEVVREYTRGKDDIFGLRKSLFETQSVLTAKKSGQIPLKELWLKKVELSESLRMVKELENLKSTPHRVQRLMQQKRYLTAVNTLNKAISAMFGEDLVAVQGLSSIREQLMDLKESLLETCVTELKTAVVGLSSDFTNMRGYLYSGSDSDEEDHPENDSVSISNRSNLTGSHYNNNNATYTNNNDENRSVLSRRSSKRDSARIYRPIIGGVSDSSSGSWSLDLAELDESLEISLTDPSASGSLYIRLLVRTIGVLQCEEDVERMVLDGLSKTFKIVGLRSLRTIAMAMLEKERALKTGFTSNDKSTKNQLGRNNNANSYKDYSKDMDDLSLHSKMFASFMSSLLDCSVLSFKRLLYLMKLLYISKMQRSTDMVNITNATDNNKHLSENHKRQIIDVWLDIEEMIIQQMLNHYVEPDVQEISDNTAGIGKGGNKSSGGGRRHGDSLGGGFAHLEKDFDDDDDDGLPLETDGLCVEGGDLLPINALIFLPSARHAAPIYKLVVNHNQQILRILSEYRLEDLLNSMLSQRGVSASNATDKNGNNSKLSYTSRSGQTIFTTTQSFLESELIPVIQSNVNHNMREIQMNNKYFSVFDTDTDTIFQSNRNDASKLNVRNNEGSNLCHAVKLCHSSAKPLFSYWLQLHQHRLMVSTVLERLVRGYASAAREEFEALTFSLMSVKESGMQAGLVQSFKQDPIFKAYRATIWATNKYNVDDFFSILLGNNSQNTISSTIGNAIPPINKSNIINTNSVRVSRSIGLSLDNTEDVKGMNALEISMWNEHEYFYVGGKTYPITSQQIVKDFQALSTIASIAYSSDWLIKKLHIFCMITAKKLHQSGDGGSGGGGNVIANSPGKSSKTASVKNLVFNKKTGNNEVKVMLFNAVLNGAKELSKLAEEGFALLRGELQLICFYFLHRLAHISYMPDPDKAYTTSSNRNGKLVATSKQERERQVEDAGTAEEEAIVTSFNDHVHQYLKAVISCSSPEALAVLLSPLCSIIPLILTRVAMHMADNSENDSDEETDDVDIKASNNHKLKSRLLRLVVSVQHSTAIHMQSFSIFPETRRKLLDTLTEGFERSRRFITMFDMPADELKDYLKGHTTEFTREETEILWLKSIGREISFAQLWNELSAVPRTGPRSSSPLQLGKRTIRRDFNK